jgi:NAD(P)-dependent dehydrogenase (short-subunit alcohol dehydrogenase family)
MEKRIAVVTGAARGIGLAIAEKLARDGAAVVITDIAESGETASSSLRANGCDVYFNQVDVSSEQEVRAAVDRITGQFGRIDILVNNAGIRPTKPFSQMVFKDWQRVLDINLNGAFYFCSAVLPVMQKKQWGRVINISSIAAQQGSTGGHTHYSASKAGMMGLSRSLAREYARFGITVNVIAPGWIDTEGWEGELDGKREEYAARVPVGRLGLPEDIAKAAAFLASDDAAYITGITLPVNGGLYIS